MKVPRPGERMRSHPLYRRKLKSKVVFDDQRPGWDSTSRDLTKYKLTDEQVEVSAVPVAHRPASPVASPDPKRGRFQIHIRRLDADRPPESPPRTQARRKQFVSKNLAAAKEELRAREDPTTLVVHPWNPPHRSPIHPAKSLGRIVDKANGGDGPRADESPSPPKVRGRNMAARGGGLGPVRFSPMKTSGGQHTRASLDRTFETVPGTNPSTNSSPAKPAEPHPPRPTPLSHEAETSGSARRLGEPPTQHNPRAEVPFAKAKSPITKTQKLDAASRTKKATDRARSLGFRPTRAPEAFTNPNGTGKPTTTDRGAPPSSGPTVPFEEEVERFRVSRLRRKMEHSFEEDKYDDDEAFDEEEAFEAPVASDSPRRIHVRDEDDAYDPDVDPFGSGVRARDAEDPIQAVRDARIELRAMQQLREAATRTGNENHKNRVGWSDGWMAGTSTADVRARQHELMAAQEAIKRQFGEQTEGGSPGSADAAPVSPEPPSTDEAVRRAAAAAANMTPIDLREEDAQEMARILRVPPMPTPRAFRPDLKPESGTPLKWGTPAPTKVPPNFKPNDWMTKTANDTFQFPPPPPEERGLMTYAAMRDAQVAAFAEHAVRRSIEAENLGPTAVDSGTVHTNTPAKPGRKVLAEVGLGVHQGFPEPIKPSTTPAKLPFETMYGDDADGVARRHVEDAFVRLSVGDENFAALRARETEATRAGPGVGASSARFGATTMPDALSALSRDGDVRRSFSNDERLQFGLRDEALAMKRLEAMKTAALKGVDANMAATFPGIRQSLEAEGRIEAGDGTGEFVRVPRDAGGVSGKGFGGFVRVGAPPTSSGRTPPAWVRVTDAAKAEEAATGGGGVPVPWFAARK